MQNAEEEICPDCNGRKYGWYDEGRIIKDKCMTCDGTGHVLVDEYGNILTLMPLQVAATPVLETSSSGEEEILF